MDTSGGFFVDTIVAKGLPEGPGVPSEVSKLMFTYGRCAHTPCMNVLFQQGGTLSSKISRTRRVATQDELFAGLKCQPGFICSRPELSEDLRTLLACVLAVLSSAPPCVLFLLDRPVEACPASALLSATVSSANSPRGQRACE